MRGNGARRTNLELVSLSETACKGKGTFGGGMWRMSWGGEWAREKGEGHYNRRWTGQHSPGYCDRTSCESVVVSGEVLMFLYTPSLSPPPHTSAASGQAEFAAPDSSGSQVCAYPKSALLPA